MLTTLTMGWELETEGPYDNEEDAMEAAEDIARPRLGKALREVKDDGSLDEGGAEIVSEPRTFSEWQALRPNVNGMLSQLRADGWKSWDGNRCGGHIHVGRDQMSADGLVRLMALMYTYENRRFWKRLCGRTSFEWCDYEQDVTDMQEIARRSKANTDWCSYDRCAVHMSSHNTVEFRLWRGSLNEERFWRNIEATHAACSFSELEQDTPTTIENFITFVATHAASYPGLAAHLVPSLSTIGA